MTYYTYSSTTKQLTPAPRTIREGDRITIPNAKRNASMGAYPRGTDTPPTPPEGKVAVPDGYELSNNAWVRTWRYEDAPPPALADYDAAMEDHLREEREARGYTTREPDAYLSSSNPRWAQDARDWVAHRDAVMEYALGLMNAVKRGEREAPPMDEFQAGLPAVEWTYAEPEAAT